MAGEVDIIGGVASGVSAGAAFGAPGMVIGGLVGGIGGLLSSGKKKKARKYTKKANALREQTYRLRSFAEQRNLLRQGQVTAATSTASVSTVGADVGSSMFQGVNASVYTQMLDNYLIGETVLNNQLQANVYAEKAGKAMNQADIINGLMGAAGTIASAIPQGRRPDNGALDPVVVTAKRVGALSTEYTSDARTFPTEGPGSVAGASLQVGPLGR